MSNPRPAMLALVIEAKINKVNKKGKNEKTK
jgi:hypothetical protein